MASDKYYYLSFSHLWNCHIIQLLEGHMRMFKGYRVHHWSLVDNNSWVIFLRMYSPGPLRSLVFHQWFTDHPPTFCQSPSITLHLRHGTASLTNISGDQCKCDWGIKTRIKRTHKHVDTHTHTQVIFICIYNIHITICCALFSVIACSLEACSCTNVRWTLGIRILYSLQ